MRGRLIIKEIALICVIVLWPQGILPTEQSAKKIWEVARHLALSPGQPKKKPWDTYSLPEELQEKLKECAMQERDVKAIQMVLLDLEEALVLLLHQLRIGQENTKYHLDGYEQEDAEGTSAHSHSDLRC